MIKERIITPEMVLHNKLKEKKFFLHYLPEKLNHFSKTKTVEYRGVKLKTSYLIDLIHNMMQKYYYRKENKFTLNATIMKGRYGHQYNYYINYLKSISAIHQIGKHIAGKQSRKYKLDSSLLSGKTTRYRNYDKYLLKKEIGKNFERELKRNNIIEMDIKFKLVNDLFSISVDHEKSMFYLDSLKNRDNDIYNRNAYSVDSIHQQHIFFHFDYYGRMHTNFTILKSFIRKNCLLMDGEETFEVDIPNSQPLFLSKIIKESGTRWVKDEEYDVFRKLLENGNFYQFLCDKLNLPDRKFAKKLTYKVLFGRNYPNSKPDIAFSSVFPTIHNYIKLYKAEHKDYRVLAYDLQKMESSIIYNRIIKKIMLIDPDVKLVTVHDSIIGKQSDRNLVERVFHDEINKFFEQ